MSFSGGSGFGLFIAKGVVNLHEGASCGATSEGLGQGSTFYVTIPTTTEAPPAAVDVAAQGGVSVLGGAGGTSDAPTFPVLNILCVVRVFAASAAAFSVFFKVSSV